MVEANAGQAIVECGPELRRHQGANRADREESGDGEVSPANERQGDR